MANGRFTYLQMASETRSCIKWRKTFRSHKATTALIQISMAVHKASSPFQLVSLPQGQASVLELFFPGFTRTSALTQQYTAIDLNVLFHCYAFSGWRCSRRSRAVGASEAKPNLNSVGSRSPKSHTSQNSHHLQRGRSTYCATMKYTECLVHACPGSNLPSIVGRCSLASILANIEGAA